MKILLSIKPEFVNQIFMGKKKYEYRKTIFKRKDIESVIIYATSPVSQIVGEFEIEYVLHDYIQKLWNETKDYSGISKDYFFTYFDKKDTGYAIKIKSYKRYLSPLNLRAVYGIAPPQSFVYID